MALPAFLPIMYFEDYLATLPDEEDAHLVAVRNFGFGAMHAYIQNGDNPDVAGYIKDPAAPPLVVVRGGALMSNDSIAKQLHAMEGVYQNRVKTTSRVAMRAIVKDRWQNLKQLMELAKGAFTNRTVFVGVRHEIPTDEEGTMPVWLAAMILFTPPKEGWEKYHVMKDSLQSFTQAFRMGGGGFVLLPIREDDASLVSMGLAVAEEHLTEESVEEAVVVDETEIPEETDEQS